MAAYREDEADFPFLVAAARQILVLYRDDPARLYELATLHGTKPGAEDVLRPPGDPDSVRQDHEEIEAGASSRASWCALPDDPERTGFRLGDDRDSRRVFASELHRGLRPGALAALMYIAGSARREAGDDLTLELAGAVRPETGKQRLEAAARSVGDGVAGPGAPLSSKYLRPPASTGYSFELLRNLSRRRPGRGRRRPRPAARAERGRGRPRRRCRPGHRGPARRRAAGRRAASGRRYPRSP